VCIVDELSDVLVKVVTKELGPEEACSKVTVALGADTFVVVVVVVVSASQTPVSGSPLFV
jgi:hypothetical protein